MIKITFPDGSVREYNEGVTGLQIAESISSRLAQDVLACGVNGETIDLTRPINEDASVVLYKWDDEQGKHAFWHTSAHLLAEALQELYPGIQFGIGPAIENGFYYDVDPGDDVVIKESDLPAIEQKMVELAARKEALVRESISKEDALKKFGERGETYKCELISELEDGHITTYTQGAFTDLCRGPHLPSTAPIKAIKLLSVAGAYWRGQEDRKQMTRIYGITFPKKKMLDEYLVMLEEAKKRDHRKIGKEMDLFMFSDMVGKGLPMWLPKGTALRIRLQDFLRRIQARYDYQEVMCPPIGNKLLYVTSGHYAKYGKDSFQPIHTPEEGEEYFLKPMNCPHHCMIYRNSPRSYRDLPLRIAEFGTVCRYEQSGELHGLTRVRSFTQDDAHIFCRPDQVKDEFLRVMDIISIVFKSMNFENFESSRTRYALSELPHISIISSKSCALRAAAWVALRPTIYTVIFSNTSFAAVGSIQMLNSAFAPVAVTLPKVPPPIMQNLLIYFGRSGCSRRAMAILVKGPMAKSTSFPSLFTASSYITSHAGFSSGCFFGSGNFTVPTPD